MPKKLVVAGGNGFLGSRICRAAHARGWTVVSLSRRGPPHWPSISSSPTAPPWSTAVSWHSANILNPSTYNSATHDLLADADAVVHTLGILLEADYKGVLTGRESVWGGLRRAFSQSKQGGRLAEKGEGEGEEMVPGEEDGQVTYELINRDSAILLAQEASRAGVGTFVYMSAAAGAPILPARYISTKREAESRIASGFPRMRNVFVRPGFLYDSSRKFTLPIAWAGGVGNVVNGMMGGRLSGVAGAAVEKPLTADLVAEAVVEAVEDGGVKGVLGTEGIEKLAGRAWRRGMV
ncbi:hypothetical protein MMC21_008012 [Puttea exsequens]|nr:hypothetical protein [Puttea exsequens]